MNDFLNKVATTYLERRV